MGCGDATLFNTYGWQGTLTQMGWSFYQGGVEYSGWLSGTQMIDGLALGEITPGPLIMVVSFVGFVGGWTKEMFGPDSLLLAGATGASVATQFAFLPSFLFILFGGPLVEATRGDIKFTSPLTGITAAMVGVILNLAVFFCHHVHINRQTGQILATLILILTDVLINRSTASRLSIISNRQLTKNESKAY